MSPCPGSGNQPCDSNQPLAQSGQPDCQRDRGGREGAFLWMDLPSLDTIMVLWSEKDSWENPSAHEPQFSRRSRAQSETPPLSNPSISGLASSWGKGGGGSQERGGLGSWPALSGPWLYTSTAPKLLFLSALHSICGAVCGKGRNMPKVIRPV